MVPNELASMGKTLQKLFMKKIYQFCIFSNRVKWRAPTRLHDLALLNKLVGALALSGTAKSM
jgi:hypothetical protein